MTSETGAYQAQVSRTALWTASARAAEQAQDDPLFHDPWAGEFVANAGEVPTMLAPGDVAEKLSSWLAVRTRFFDDHLLEAARGGCAQLVLLGAGLDARAYRLDWPDGVRVFEVDLPSVLEFKEEVLRGRWPDKALRVPVGADLTADWKALLLEAGFDPAVRTAWLCEGVLFYLDIDAVGRLADDLGELSAPGSTLGADCFSAAGGDSDVVRSWLGTISISGLSLRWAPSSPGHWWSERGWRITSANLSEIPYAVGRFARHTQLITRSREAGVHLLTGTIG